MLSKCTVCGSKKSKFIKEQQAKGTKYHVVIIKKKVHKFIFTTNPFIILKSATFRVNFTHYQAFISTI